MCITLAQLIIASSFSEGTKEFRPTTNDVGNLQINDVSRPFALESNTDPLHRLYFHISSTTEKVYFGFQHVGTGTATFRIKDPADNVVYNRTNIPLQGTGYIATYAAAVAGPKIGGLPTIGYTPFTYSPLTIGDFYLEFTTSLTAAYHFDLFDLTIVNSSNIPIPGRLWSYAWDLNTRSSTGRYNGLFYFYSDDKYVSKLNMNGIQPYGFVVSCNQWGTSNLANGNNNNRKSVSGNSTAPQFKVFLNDPDISIYTSGTIPSVVTNLQLANTPIYGQPVLLTLNISTSGVVQIILDINATPGYQSNTEDRILVEQIHSGLDSIWWDAKDGFGNFVTGGATVSVTSSFASGTTHLPIYDPENHEFGFIVNRIRPSTGLCKLYWDDSNFAGGIVNIDGSITTGHNWINNFGDVRTMNTWWNGYELEVLNSFDFIIQFFQLPVELLYFNGSSENDKINLEWATASETNNQYFIIEKSVDLVTFETIQIISGAGNSNNITSYTITDQNALVGANYYRMKQVDYDGTVNTKDVILVNITPAITKQVRISTNENNLQIDLSENLMQNKNLKIKVYSLDGKLISEKIIAGSTNRIVTNIGNYKGLGIVELCGETSNYSEKFFK